jgi:GT2 family glycosyltransferase
MNRLLVVIVNTATPDMVIDCLRSLAPELRLLPETEVVVVNNPMGDDSEERIAAVIEDEAYDWCRMVPSDKNGGFAYGNNVAIRAALASSDRPEYIMLLNPDTIVRPRALKELIGFMDEHPRAGVCGSQLEGPDGQLDLSGHRMPTPLSEAVAATRLGILYKIFAGRMDDFPIRDENFECDWVSGAALFARTEVFEKIGLLDEALFVYFEEPDFCSRARAAGWEVWIVAGSRILHLEGQTTGISVAKKRRAAYWYNSRRYFFVKHYGVIGLVAADLGWLLGRTTFLIRRVFRLGGSTDKDPRHFTRDLILGDLRALVNGSAFRRNKPNPSLEEAGRLGF